MHMLSSVEMNLQYTSAERHEMITSNPFLTLEQKDFLLGIPVTIDEQIQHIFDNLYISSDEQNFHIRRLLISLSNEFDVTIADMLEILPSTQRNRVEILDLGGTLFDVMESASAMMRDSTAYQSFEPHRMGGQQITITMPVRHAPQIRNNWCGPATAEQTLRTFGWNVTQTTLEREMFWSGGGTDLASVHRAVDSRLRGTWNYRAPVFIRNRSAIMSNIYHAFRFSSAPPMIRIQSHGGGWPYLLSTATSGHFTQS